MQIDSEKNIKRIFFEFTDGKIGNLKPYKKKTETPNKDTRGWCAGDTRGWFVRETRKWVMSETPESYGQQLPGWHSAFTLIELLVVVLIIGILTAIAVPQYQKVLEKSKASQALVLLQTLSQAADEYFIANGQEFSSFNVLSVSVPWATSARVIGLSQDSRSNGEWTLEVEKSLVSGHTVIFITRMTGPYKGAGFSIKLRTEQIGHLNKQIKCFERKSSATVLFDKSLSSGDYCEKILNATFFAEDEWSRGYLL